MIETTLTVPAISCAHCKGAIEGAVAQLDGVDTVTVDIAGRRVDVRFDEGRVKPDAIVAAIEGAGYEVPDGARPVAG